MPKSITHLAKAGSKESLLHWHQHLPPVGKGREDTLRLGFAIQSQRQVSAPHRFGVWDVRRHHSVSPIEMRACRIALFHSGLTRLCSGDCPCVIIMPTSIRPSAHGNHEYVDWFRSVTELWIQPHR